MIVSLLGRISLAGCFAVLYLLVSGATCSSTTTTTDGGDEEFYILASEVQQLDCIQRSCNTIEDPDERASCNARCLEKYEKTYRKEVATLGTRHTTTLFNRGGGGGRPVGPGGPRPPDDDPCAMPGVTYVANGKGGYAMRMLEKGDEPPVGGIDPNCYPRSRFLQARFRDAFMSEKVPFEVTTLTGEPLVRFELAAKSDKQPAYYRMEPAVDVKKWPAVVLLSYTSPEQRETGASVLMGLY